MGAVDSFYIDRKMPEGFQLRIPEGQPLPDTRNFPDGSLYQTKCLDGEGDIYTVGEDNILKRCIVGKSLYDIGALEVVRYTGTVNIYAGIPQPGEYGYPSKYIVSLPEPTVDVPVWRWVEFTLTFDAGVLVDIKFY